jgi:hypothetical protein
VERSAKIYPRVVLALAFLLAFVVSLLRALEIESKGGDAYRVGDWLINYEGGFVRRGLLGQLLLWEGRSFPGTLLPLVLCIQVVLYGMLLLWGYRLLGPHVQRRTSILLLGFSPASFLFEALNPQGFRKELLGLVVLAVFCHAVQGQRLRIVPWLWCLGLIFPALILSHEAMVLLLPYFLMAGLPRVSLFSEPHPLWSRAAVGFLIVSSLLAFVAAVHAAGDEQKVQDIMESLRGLVPRASLSKRGTHGSIQALQHSASKAFHDQKSRFAARDYDYPIKYTVILGLTALPFLANWDCVSRVWSKNASRLLLVGAAALTIVLCLIAKDWGRFIYMNAAAFSLVLLSQSPLSRNGPKLSVWAWLGLSLSYASLWRVPISAPSLDRGIIFQVNSALRECDETMLWEAPR